MEAICLVGQLPRGWRNPEERRKDEASLRIYRIRIMTYDEMINGARSGYAKFAKNRESLRGLRETIDAIRAYRPSGGS